MFAAISGLRNHQTMMDVVGNNISNVNTTGFKSSQAVFSEVLSQTIRGAGAATGTTGGSNPAQIGLGSRVSAVTSSFSQGALQVTSRSTDFAIQGDGFFVVDQGGERLYTRAGSFSVDALGRLVTQDGGLIQGWQSSGGTMTTSGPIGPIVIPVGDLIPPVQTTTARLGGNLPADAAVGDPIVAAVQVFDGQGTAINVRVEFTKTANDTWSAGYRYVDAAGALQPPTTCPPTALSGGPVTFDSNGQVTSSHTLTLAGGVVPGFAAGQDIAINLGDLTDSNHVSQFGELSSLAALDQDGQSAGSLTGFSVSQDGLLVGSYTNGRTRPIGQLSLANFANPEGMEKAGGSTNYRATVNSGLPQIGVPSAGGRGLIAGGALEMSNVDLAREFTNLIIAQRGFQANSRVITTSDEMLQEVVNLKR
jgi:flagellar hook protein FlgE